MSENNNTVKAPKNFVPTPFSYRQQIELHIDDINNFGLGVGRIDGWVVTVPFAITGETVLASVYKNHKNYSEADLIRVISPSPSRREPFCPLYEKCGGCQYQHLDYSAQLEWKRRQIVQLMKRIGGIEFPVEPTIPSPKQSGYRSKLTPHYERPRNGEMPVGFFMAERRNKIIDVPQCPIASDAINAALPLERERIKKIAPSLKRGGTLLLRDTLDGICTDNRAVAREKISGLTYEFYAGEFFQNNPHILPALVRYAINMAKGPRFLVDAYCGVGVFALAASKDFEKIAGIEISEKAIACAKSNAALNGVSNCEFFAGKAETIFEGVSKIFDGGDCSAIIDPPRSGCDSEFLQQLCSFAPRKIIYVSCGPDTQARDLAFLVANGYKLASLQPFDLFPQTRHVENVAVLERLS